MPRDGKSLTRRRALRIGGGIATGGFVGLAGCSGGDGGSGADGGSTPTADSGDGSASTPTETATPAPTQVVHGAVEGGTTGILTTVMKEQGIDTKHGIDLQPKYFTSPPNVQQQLMFNDDIPTAYMGSIVATRMHAEGQQPQLVGPYMLNHTYVLAQADGPVQEPADLAGAKVSFASTAADAWLKFVVLLEEAHGVAPDELEFVQSAPPAALSLLERGEVDAILSFEPLVTIAETKFDFDTIFVPREAWEEQESLPLTTVDLAWVKPWYDANPDAGVGLAKALKESQVYIQENMSTVIEQNADSFGFETQEQIDLGKERLTEIYPTEWNRDDFVESELEMVKRAKSLGLIEPEPTEDIFNWVL